MKILLRLACVFATIFICSAAVPAGRIVGGDDAVPGQVPYQAGLFIGGSPNCGAAILSERYALTAMRCVCSTGSDKPWPPQLFMVAAGTTDLYQGGTRIRVQEIRVNPNYSSFETGLAILKLEAPFPLSETIQPIALARENPPFGTYVDVSGWGRTKAATEADMYRTLQVNDGTVIEPQNCASGRARDSERSVTDIVCVGHNRKNGICLGDFGGPAAYQNQLVGIAATVLGECGSYLPDVFVSVADNYEWIVEQMQK